MDGGQVAIGRGLNSKYAGSRQLQLDRSSHGWATVHLGPIAPGFELGPYLLTERLGAGGMGQVFRAQRRDAAVQRSVVVKRILPTCAGDERVVAMFREEARLLALLDHTNIVKFLELCLEPERGPLWVRLRGEGVKPFLAAAGLGAR